MPYKLSIVRPDGKRKPYFGILKSPISRWKTKTEARNSRAYKRMQRLGYKPRVVKARKK